MPRRWLVWPCSSPSLKNVPLVDRATARASVPKATDWTASVAREVSRAASFAVTTNVPAWDGRPDIARAGQDRDSLGGRFVQPALLAAEGPLAGAPGRRAHARRAARRVGGLRLPRRRDVL